MGKERRTARIRPSQPDIRLSARRLARQNRKLRRQCRCRAIQPAGNNDQS